MNYTLVVLTHGDGPTLEQCLDSFEEYVAPAPALLHVIRDGYGYSYMPSWAIPSVCTQVDGTGPVGFCRATRSCWGVMANAPTDYVFYLEHDFVFTRALDLEPLAYELARDHRLAQMALMRNAVNEQEIAAGGLFESRADQCTPRWRDDRTLGRENPYPAGGEFAPAWHEHRAYFTTNPSLMRTDFIRENPWPADSEPHCEGRYGIHLVEQGYRFGFWGAGEPWVEHIGIRDGFGY